MNFIQTGIFVDGSLLSPLDGNVNPEIRSTPTSPMASLRRHGYLEQHTSMGRYMVAILRVQSSPFCQRGFCPSRNSIILCLGSGEHSKNLQTVLASHFEVVWNPQFFSCTRVERQVSETRHGGMSRGD